MKKLTLVIFLAVAACMAVAQGPGPGKAGGPGMMRGGGQRMTPQQRMEKMKKDYNLSDSQVKKIEAYDKAERPERDKLMKGPGDMKSKMAQFKKLRDARDAKMKGIMNKDQYAKYQKDMAKRMSRMMGGGRRGGGGRPGGPGGPPKAGGA